MQALPIYQIIFYLYAALLIVCALGVILPRNPVHSALFLVLAFFCSAVLWMLLQAEFLSLVLIFVYVGAVMTLFLFVVMMINLDLSQVQQKFVRYLPYAILVIVLLVGTMWLVLSSKNPVFSHAALTPQTEDYSNTTELGQRLFTQYIYPFEIAGLLLLAAIVAVITLAFHGRKMNTKAQKIAVQLAANKQQRLRIVSLKE